MIFENVVFKTISPNQGNKDTKTEVDTEIEINILITDREQYQNRAEGYRKRTIKNTTSARAKTVSIGLIDKLGTWPGVARP